MTAVLEPEELTPTYVDPAADARRRAKQVMLEEAAFMRGVLGMGWPEIAARLGVQEGSLRKAVGRARKDGIVIE